MQADTEKEELSYARELIDDLERDFYAICRMYGGTPEYKSHHLFRNEHMVCRNADLRRITSGWGIGALLRKAAYTLDELKPVPPMKTKEGFPLAWSPRSIFFEIIDEGGDSRIELRLDKNMDGTLKADEEIKVGWSLVHTGGGEESTQEWISGVILRNLKWKLEDMKAAGLSGKCEPTFLFRPSLHCKFSSDRISPEVMKREGALSTGNLVAEIIRLLPTP